MALLNRHSGWMTNSVATQQVYSIYMCVCVCLVVPSMDLWVFSIFNVSILYLANNKSKPNPFARHQTFATATKTKLDQTIYTNQINEFNAFISIYLAGDIFFLLLFICINWLNFCGRPLNQRYSHIFFGSLNKWFSYANTTARWYYWNVMSKLENSMCFFFSCIKKGGGNFLFLFIIIVMQFFFISLKHADMPESMYYPS